MAEIETSIDVAVDVSTAYNQWMQLEAFKDSIESRGEETGAWRGEIAP